jgi:hypothetical protein
VSNITTSGNVWAGIVIYIYGQYYTGGFNNITLTDGNGKLKWLKMRR